MSTVTSPGWTEEVIALVGESAHSFNYLARSLAGPGSYAQWDVAAIVKRDMFPWRRNGTMLYVDVHPPDQDATVTRIDTDYQCSRTSTTSKLNHAGPLSLTSGSGYS